MWWAIAAIWIVGGPGLRQIRDGLNDLNRYLDSKSKDNDNNK